MLSQNYSIVTDAQGREMIKRGTPLFPCSIYKRDVHDYTADQISPHWHKELELFFLDEGCVKLSLMEDAYILHPGEGFFVNGDILHGITCVSDAPCRFRSIIFDSAVISGAPGSVFDVMYVRPFTESGIPFHIFNSQKIAREVFDHFTHILESFQCKTEGFEFLVRYELSEIVLLLKKCSENSTVKRTSQKEINIRKMLSYLDENYSKHISITQLAAHVHLCVRECQRTFSSVLHMTPKQYLQNRRISAAAELLFRTDIPVIDIGLQCGFESPSYFSKVFKAMMGMSPGAYRKQHSKDPDAYQTDGHIG